MSESDYEFEDDNDKPEDPVAKLRCMRQVYRDLHYYSRNLSLEEQQDIYEESKKSGDDGAKLAELLSRVPQHEQEAFFGRNPEMVQLILRHEPMCFPYVPARWRNDSEFIDEAVVFEPKVFAYISEKWQKDKSMVLAAFDGLMDSFAGGLGIPAGSVVAVSNGLLARAEECEPVFGHAPLDMISDHEFLVKLLKRDGAGFLAFKSIFKRVTVTQELLKKLCGVCALVLNFVDRSFLDNRELVLLAVSRNVNLGILPKRFASDRDVAWTLLRNDLEGRDPYVWLDPKFKKDREVLMQGMLGKHNWRKLYEWAGPSMFDDAACVLLAALHNPDTIELASERMKDDISLAQTACLHGGKYFKMISRRWQLDPEMAIMVWRANREKAYPLPGETPLPELADNLEFLLTALDTFHPDLERIAILDFASPRLRTNEEFLRKYYTAKEGEELCNLLQNDDEEYHALARSVEFANASVDVVGDSLQWFEDCICNNPEVVRRAIKNDPQALLHASVELRSRRDIVELAVSKDPSTLELASGGLRQDTSIVLPMLRRNMTAIAYAHPVLLQSPDIIVPFVTDLLGQKSEKKKPGWYLGNHFPFKKQATNTASSA